MRYLLNCSYLVLLGLLSPWLIYAAIRHGKYRQGLGQKLLGLVPVCEDDTRRIWFHAVSVGEVNLLATLLQELQAQRPDVQVVISTTTKTGYELARRTFDEHTVFYCPLDFSWAVKQALRRVRPDLLVLVELELWPNLLMEAGRQSVPVAIVNGRLSDKSTRGYLRLGSLMRRWLASVEFVAAQSQACADRFVQLGVGPERVTAIGSVKFDGAETDRNNPRTGALRRLAGLQSDELVFLAGSTQAPEEGIALDVYQQLRGEFPQLRLILAPRHPERCAEVASLLNEASVAWVRRSELGAISKTEPTNLAEPAANIELANNESVEKPILLVDTVGELGGWWGTADIGFVGGSLGKRGGQNMLEPAGYGVATCFGPNTRNFRDVVAMLLQEEAAEVVCDSTELARFVSHCAREPEYRRSLGHRAQRLVQSQRGAAKATIRRLCALLVANQNVAELPLGGEMQTAAEPHPAPDSTHFPARKAG